MWRDIWEGSYKIDIDLTQTFITQLLWAVLALFFTVFVIIIAIIFRNKKIEKRKKLKNLQKVEECFEEVSSRILWLEDKVRFFKLLKDGKELEKRFEDVTVNFKSLKEYYEGIKKSYSDSEFKTFLTIYNILKGDLDYLQERLESQDKTLQEELKYIKKVQEALGSVKNTDILKQKIDRLFAERLSDSDLKEEIEGIRKIDEKIEYFKTLDDEKKKSYITGLLQILTERFEEKYPVVLSRAPAEALELQREFDDLLLKLQVSSDFEKIVLSEDFLYKLAKMQSSSTAGFQQKDKAREELVERFEKVLSSYDSIGFRFYKIDIEIERIKSLLESSLDNKELEREITELENLVLDFKSKFLECRGLLVNFERFLKEAKNKLGFEDSAHLFDSYCKDLRELLYSSDFDEFKKRYIEYQNAVYNTLLKSSSNDSSTIKKVIKDLFDEFLK